VTCRDDDSVWVLDVATGATRRVLATGRGTSPVAVVFDPLGANGYIALEGTGRVHRVAQTATQLGASVDVGPTPRALAITGDGSRLLVSQFVSTEGVGRVRSVALAGLTAGPTIPLPLDTTSIDGSLAARGLPNYLVGIAIHPASGQAWVVGKKDNVVRGSLRDGQPLTFETTVRALVARIDLALDQERTNERVDLDNQSQPSAVALGPSGEQAFVTVQGTNQLIVLNQLGGEIARASTGLAPQGVAIDPTTKRVFTQDFMGRTVSVFDATQVLSQGSGPLPRIAQVQTTTNEKLSPAVLLGKRIFYNAEDPRMSRDGYISCASCHLDGGHDGQVWDFTDRGEGLRNTISLRGQGGNAGAPLHWTGNFDEVQDFENDIRSFFGGSGFMNGVDFATGTRSQPLGDPKAGISAELDALASYVDSLDDAGRSPFRLADGSLSASAQAGQAIFQQLGCQSCHSGARFSDSPTGARHDVGTIKASSGQRAGGVLDGLDTPTLLGLPASAPYLHDGSASTLLEVLTTANSAGQHGDTSGLSPGELNQLVDYLLQLESQAP
jgi:DNA-binding beta-propeller fold protein YncE